MTKKTEKEEDMTKAATNRILQGIIVFMLGLSAMTGAVYADKGQLYSCLIQRDYRHPVSGVIEDSGGEHAFDIGQGMVEGTVYNNGLLEASESGELVLTFRMSLADFSGHYHFWVQSEGRGNFQAVDYRVTHQGTDANGTTKDIAITLPDINSVIRGSMFVEPMGREVVFYLSPAGLEAGYSGDMVAQLVTETDEYQDRQDKVVKEALAPKVVEKSQALDQETKKSQEQVVPQSASSSTLTAKKLHQKKSSKLGLTTSLDQKTEEKSKGKKALPVIIYYLPTLFLILGGAAAWVWRKRRKDDKTS
ncbi:hypothetical protein FMV2238Y02_09480 [Streptococcus canis]|uniref:Cell surface protein Shp haem-binding domain-containing protein n=2 Tax=Streptococcus canis TaxID=1329 RepID=A0A3P5Y236_STRCB|nr:heme-binding Shp domain-containing protein [Streptococcus canis]VDC42501.1 hypothetical protein FMV2238Y02_09480 [Streptococcus canis]